MDVKSAHLSLLAGTEYVAPYMSNIFSALPLRLKTIVFVEAYYSHVTSTNSTYIPTVRRLSELYMVRSSEARKTLITNLRYLIPDTERVYWIIVTEER